MTTRYRKLADKQVIDVNTPAGNIVTRLFEIPPDNGFLLCVTVILFGVGGATPSLFVSIQLSNDGGSWETDIANTLGPIIGIGYYEKRYDSIGAKYARVTYGSIDAGAIVAVGIHTSEL